VTVRARRSLLAALALAGAGLSSACGARPSAPRSEVKAAAARPIEGSLLLASAGPDFAGGSPPARWIAGAPGWLVRGRVRWHLDDDGGATRSPEVIGPELKSAFAVAPHLGGGVVMLTDSTLFFAPTADAPARALVGRNAMARETGNTLFASLTNGAEGLIGVGSDGAVVRIEPRAPRVIPIDDAMVDAIAAPIVATPPTAGFAGGKGGATIIGDAASGGPEFASREVGYALVELLGVLRTSDGGKNWAPLDAERLSSTLAGASPSRLIRTTNGVGVLARPPLGPDLLATLGAGSTPTSVGRADRARAPAIPEVLWPDVEGALPYGVRQPDDTIVVFSGRTFARVQLDPLRVVDALTPTGDLGDCRLRPSPHALALALCTSFEGAPRQVIGLLHVEGGRLRWSLERTLPLGVPTSLSPTGAVLFAEPCERGGGDAATAGCVRAVDGSLHVARLGPARVRELLTPLADGRLLAMRAQGAESGPRETTLVLERDGRPDAPPVHFALHVGAAPSSFGEHVPGEVALWSREGTSLHRTRIDVRATTPRVLASRVDLLKPTTKVGAFGGHALLLELAPAAKGEPSALASLAQVAIDDAAPTTLAWPLSAKAIETREAADPSCGREGCRMLGWSRVGWSPRWRAVDRVAEAQGALPLPPSPPTPAPLRAIYASCRRAGPMLSLPRERSPASTLSLGFGDLSAVTSLGGPLPALAPGETRQAFAFATPGMRGGLTLVRARTSATTPLHDFVFRWVSDLDRPSTINESRAMSMPELALTPWGTQLTGVALGPHRLLAVIRSTSWGARGPMLYRLVDGAPPAAVTLPVEGVTSIDGALERNGRLVILGRRGSGDGSRPFIAIEGDSGFRTETFGPIGGRELFESIARRRSPLFLAADRERDAFGIALPARGGRATWLLPLDGDGVPQAGFVRLPDLDPLIAGATKACDPRAPGWSVPFETRPIRLFVRVGDEPMRNPTIETVTVRVRHDERGGSCLESLSASGVGFAFAVSAWTGATELIEPTPKDPSVEPLSCSVQLDDDAMSPP
jgi:hypothetical protein